MTKHLLSAFFMVACLSFMGSSAHYPVVPTTERTEVTKPETKTSVDIPQSQKTPQINTHKRNYANPQEKIQEEKIVADSGETFPLRVYRPLLTPNDPSYNQWWVDNIDLTASWDIPAGSNQTLLAVIDTGFALDHQEFSGRWFSNTGEQGGTASEAASDLNCTDQGRALAADCNNIDDDGDGINDNESSTTVTDENPSRLNCTGQGLPLDKSCNMIDDDGNGLVDDWRGWDFINHDRSVQAGEMNPDGEGTQHGTLVTGAAAATGNNGLGMAGVDWHTTILPLQALDDDSYGHTLSVARSVEYAVDMGADVISISLGSDLPDQYLRNAIADAIAQGVIVVAASGNDSCECILYPANYPEVVAVGASTSLDQRASFSNYGSNLDIVAPGTSIYTTNWSKTNGTSAYGSASGTSLSTPIVSGLLTRMRSHQPNATTQQLLAALTENTDRITLAASQHHSSTVGYGKLNTQKALQRATQAATKLNATEFTAYKQGAGFELLPVQARIYDCGVSGKKGTSPLYELNKNGDIVFTISEVERSSLLSNGYTSALFSYVCLNLPGDIFNEARTLNLFREFKNDHNKD